MDVSIGVFAYNEEKNVGVLLDKLIGDDPGEHQITEIFVVSSGSTDRTDEIIKEYEKKDPRVKLIAQDKREGKASAINEFLKKASGDVFILESADTLPGDDTIRKMIDPFADPMVGLVGAKPVPINDPETFMGFTVHLIWRLHDRLAMRRLKAGELIAVKNIIKSIPVYTAVDEAWIESMVDEKGLAHVYVPEAKVYNKGPENLSDIIRQRRRIYTGHLHLRRHRGYSPLTMSLSAINRALLAEVRENPKKIHWILGACLLEAYIRLVAAVDYYILKRNPFRWEVIPSTKELK